MAAIALLWTVVTEQVLARTEVCSDAPQLFWPTNSSPWWCSVLCGTHRNLKAGKVQRSSPETWSASDSDIHTGIQFRKPVSQQPDLKVEQPNSRGFHRIAWVSRAELNITQLILVIGTRAENTVGIKPFFGIYELTAFLPELALFTYQKAAFRRTTRVLIEYHWHSCFSFSLLVHCAPNILMNYWDKKALKNMFNDALRNKRLSLLGAWMP